MKHPKKIAALTHADGNVSVMQIYEDVDIGAEVAKSVFMSPVVEWREIEAEEMADIRARRPKPQPKKPEALGGQVVVNGPDHSETIAELTGLVTALATELNAIKHRVERTEIIADAIERGVEESAKNG